LSAGHGAQLLVWGNLAKYPAAHAWHVSDSTEVWNLPAGQGVQRGAIGSENIPARQRLHVAAFFSLENLPFGHARHLWSPAALLRL
jgi:hypothetical protein